MNASKPFSHILIRTLIISTLSVVASIANAAVTFIDIWEYQVQGNTLLDEELIQRRLTPYLGVARTLEDAEAAVETLTNAYKNAGYPTVYVDIPQQTVVNGRFILRVNENPLKRVRISDASYFLPSAIRDAMPSLQQGRAINFPALQEEIQNVNTLNPKLKVIPLLKQGPTPQSVELELSVADELPFRASLELNNYHSESTTDTRLVGVVGYSNLWQKYHDASLTIQTSPEDTNEVRVASLSYVMPGDTINDKWAFYAIRSDSETASVGDITVFGEGEMFGARYIHPLEKVQGKIQTLIVGGDYKRFDETILDEATPISYATLTAQLSQYQRTETWNDSFSLAFTVGFRGLSNNDAEFEDKRNDSPPTFGIIKGEYERSYPFADHYEFRARLKAQITDMALVSNEQMSAGGASSVRGYFESQVSGDMGLLGGMELEKSFLDGKYDWLQGLSISGFLEGAYVKSQDTLPEEDESVGISSYGLGVRMRLLKDFYIKWDSAAPFEHEGATIKQNEFRHHLSLKYEY